MSLRQTGKRWIKTACIKGGLVRWAARFAQPGIAILRYHSVQHQPEHYANSIGAGIIHSLSTFREQMEFIARHYNPVTIDDVLGFLNEERKLPKRSVAVTFDDGYADNFELAAPVMNHFGIRGSFYVTVNAVEAGSPPWFCRLRNAFWSSPKNVWLDSTGGYAWPLRQAEQRRTAFLVASDRCARLAGAAQEETLQGIEDELQVEPLTSKDCPMMGWEQVRKLQQAGHLIGSHTLSHPNTAYVSDDVLLRELVQSRLKLEAQLGTSVVHFSYPNPIQQPHYTARTVTSTAQAGYRTAVTSTSGPVRAGQDPLALRRVPASVRLEEFAWNLQCTFLGRAV